MLEIGVGIGMILILLGIAMWVYRKYPFQQKKLKDSKYDGYALYLAGAALTMYLMVHTWVSPLSNGSMIDAITLLLLFPFAGIALGWGIKQIIYDYHNQKLPFQR